MYSHRKSLNFGQYVPNDKVLNKKVPENPKYKHVKPAVDTGKNVKRHIDELKEKQKNCHHKKDEVFNRVKFSTFIKLAITVAKEIFKQDESGDCIIEENVENSSETNKVDKSRLANVLMGIGEIDLRNEKQKKIVPPKIEKKVPYLLLDVRDRDEFLRSHIKTARHYPAAMLSRSIGYEIEEMKHYKNNRPELIIVYDDDESIASRVATTLVQRGYENIYLLSGGNYVGSCKSGTSFSRSDKSLAHSSRAGGLTEYSSRSRLINSRKDSACSSRSNEPVKSRTTIRSFIDDRPQSVKKAPWKVFFSQLKFISSFCALCLFFYVCIKSSNISFVRDSKKIIF
ncbi:UNVERIFIED_CONTAM: cep41-b [Trichonephila clavipes]